MTTYTPTSSSHLMRLEGGVDEVTKKDDITVVIPTLNEEKAIGLVIKELMNEGYFNIIVVDGYSSDKTVHVARQYNVNIVEQRGKGKTGALKTAIEHVTTPYIMVIDGDFTYDPKDIEKFLTHMRNYNEIIGARIIGRDNISRINRFGNWFINVTFNVLFGTNLTDICSGMYYLKKEFAENLNLETNGFDVEVEIAAQAVNSGSITQIPISYRKRIGDKKLRILRDGFTIMTTILKLSVCARLTSHART